MPQAQQAWRAVFAEALSLEGYKTLKRLAAASWEALRPELMAILRKSYSTQVLAHAYALLGQTEVWRVYLQRLQEQLRRLERG